MNKTCQYCLVGFRYWLGNGTHSTVFQTVSSGTYHFLILVSVKNIRSEGLGGRRSHATQASCNPVIFNDFQAKDPLADSKTEQGPYYLYCTLYCFILNWAFNNIKDGSCCSMANVSYVSITSWVELMSDLNKLQNNTFFPQENVCTVETIIHTDQYVSVIY